MKTNISFLNRGIRINIGVVLCLVATLILSPPNFFILGIGLVLLGTGLVGFCPINYYFHFKQLPDDK